MKKTVLGIGNALVDVLSHVEDTFVQTTGYPKGSMQLVDWKEASRIITQLKNFEQSSGGSASNSICALGELGIESKFIGKIGDDDLGVFYLEDMKHRGVQPFVIHGNKPTGICCSLITPDRERTLLTYLGAAVELDVNELSPHFFENIGVVYIEGYLIHNQELINRSIQLAKNNQAAVAMDLSSFNLVAANRDYLRSIIDAGIGILFANEEEIFELTGLPPYESICELRTKTPIIVIKLGAKGSIIGRGSEVVTVSPIPVTAIDTTGAGDSYAAGFIYGFLNSQPLSICGAIGSLIASRVVSHIGPKLSNKEWEELLPLIDKMIGPR